MTDLKPLNAFDSHPARQMDFDVLLDGLHAARKDRALSYVEGPDDSQLWRYSNRCVFDRMWTPLTVLARGLILDMAARRVVATPFPKFFNLGEDGGGLPEKPFDVFEKLDGSLIIIFWHRGRWRAATRGAFESEQALWATDQLKNADLSGLTPGATYLAEAIYPENKIVVQYESAALVMLGGYAEDGQELSYQDVQQVSKAIGWRAAERYTFASIIDMMTHVATLPKDKEGYVLRFVDGQRIKLKGAEYRRIHALISNVTPLAVLGMMQAGDDLIAIRRELPEEYWTDFDDIVQILTSAFDVRIEKIRAVAETLQHLSDKEIGLQLASVDQDVRSHIFAYRKAPAQFPSGKSLESIWRDLRPTGNMLDGYTPSYAMERMMDDAL
jgi:RNA ligase